VIPFVLALALGLIVAPQRPWAEVAVIDGDPVMRGLPKDAIPAIDEPIFVRADRMVPVAKKTTKNQLTLPKAIVDRFPGVSYFDVREEDGRIVLSPVVPDGADRVREKLQEMGLGPEDIREAVRWARHR